MTQAVVILGFPGVQGLDIVGPHDVFTGAALLTEGGYRVSVVSLDGQPISTPTSLAFVAQAMPDPHDIDTLVLPGGAGVDAARQDPDTIAWITTAAASSRRVVTVCTGAFLAASAGLLDGCRVTTHWAFADQLAREFPTITVDPEPIFVRSSNALWTAAGVTAGIDLSLALVEEDYGTEVAQAVARWLVLYLRRPGGQLQFAAPLWAPRAGRQAIRDVQEAIEAEPGAAHSISELAQRAAMSPRHFTRVFTEQLGEAPSAYVEQVRTEAARRQLEETDDTVVTIAERCGFGTSETMRRTFIRRVGIPPDQYRRSFS
ncbi:AraC family transcriptional regulator [Mycolicibacterium sphagni]|uniref:AraC family transcriptional regulator n=1 Tax=Mycolicibacterium sphagni TaxID=1786 RepID=A0A255D9I4_9MYCO|nr:AraC family transcriptional regulator [Mycolicibacterium sphagni]